MTLRFPVGRLRSTRICLIFAMVLVSVDRVLGAAEALSTEIISGAHQSNSRSRSQSPNLVKQPSPLRLPNQAVPPRGCLWCRP